METSTEEGKNLARGNKSKTRLILNPSNRLFSWIMPWNIGLALMEPLSALLDPTERLLEPYVKKGQVVADLGCGRGYYSIASAKLVGEEGKVYAVDLNGHNIKALEKKARKGGYRNIETHISSASNLSFIENKSVDFILANGLL